VRWKCFAALLVVSAHAAAQTSFTADFETPNNLGPWSFTLGPQGNQRIIQAIEAPKRGVFGARFSDPESGPSGVGNQMALVRTSSGTGDQFLRFWWRVPQSSTTFASIRFALLHGTSSVLTLAEAKYEPQQARIALTCFDRSSQGFTPSSFPFVDDGGFHLVELSAGGVGQMAGRCALALDGQATNPFALNYQGLEHAAVLVGPAYGDNNWIGEMHYDDVAAGSVPFASRLTVTRLSVELGSCHQLQFEGVSSFTSTTGAPLPFRTRVQLTSDAGAFFTDPQCALPVSALVVDGGATAFTVYVRPVRLGRVEVLALGDDLLPSLVPLTVLAPDAGVDGGQRDGGGDAGSTDSGVDAGADNQEPDGGPSVDDAGLADAGPPDGGGVEVGLPDAGVPQPLGPRAQLAVGCGCGGSSGLLTLLVLLFSRRKVLKLLRNIGAATID
jgi:uncharacterized protein (TIGR03382 family)